MSSSGRYNQVEVAYGIGGFSLDFRADWDPPSAALFGPSGSGKSTLLEVIAGVRAGARGRVILDGRTIFDSSRGVQPPAPDRWIGWVPQDASLFPHLTVADNVRYGLPRGGTEGKRRLEAAIEVLELGRLLPREATALSGGERQRAAIARAVGSGARVLLLDEPLASLDVPLRARVLPLFFRLRDELKIPMIYVSHDPDEVLALARHVMVIDQGRCVASGPSREILGHAEGRPFEQYLAENRFEARLESSHPEDGTATVEIAPGLRLIMSVLIPPSRASFPVSIRADEILLAAQDPGPVSAQNVIPAKVSEVREARGHAWIGLAPEGHDVRFTVQVTRRALTTLGLKVGARAFLLFKASSVRPAGRTGA